MGVDLILAGIYAEEKLVFMEKIVPVAIHKKKKSDTFDCCIIQLSQIYCLYLDIEEFTSMRRIQNEKVTQNLSARLESDRLQRGCKGGN